MHITNGFLRVPAVLLVRSSSVKSVCFIVTLGWSSHVVNLIDAHAFNPELIDVGHMIVACVSPLPKTTHKLPPGYYVHMSTF